MWITLIRCTNSLTTLTAYSYLYFFCEYFDSDKNLDALCFHPKVSKLTANKIHARSGKLSKHPDSAKIILWRQLQSSTNICCAMGLEISKTPSNDIISWQKPTNVSVFQLKSAKGKEGRWRKDLEEERKRKKIELNYSFHIYTWLH